MVSQIEFFQDHPFLAMMYEDGSVHDFPHTDEIYNGDYT